MRGGKTENSFKAEGLPIPLIREEQKKARCRQRAESIFLEENRGDRRIVLHCGIFFQFIFVMTDINTVNTCDNVAFSSSCKLVCPSGTGMPGSPLMATVLTHRRVKIVVLEADEPIASHCGPGDIAIVAAADGWWNHFIGSDGTVDSYDRPYKSYNEALWAAKAAAEFGFS